MASGLNRWSTTAASNATADSTVNWAEGQSPSSVNDSARAMMARIAEWRDYISGKINTAGSADAYTFSTGDTGNTALSDGYRIAFNCHATNTGASTINVDSLGAKPLRVATGVALGAGALVAGSIYSATYDSGGDEWLLQGTTVADLAITTAKLAADSVTYAKMQNVSATSRVLGRKTSGSGDVEELTVSEIFDFFGSTAQGDITYRDSTGWSRLGAGTSGYYLKTQGPSANPVWAALPSTGSALASFSVHKNGTDQNVAASTTSKLTFGTEVYDVGSCWDTSTSRWTPPAGRVLLSGSVDILLNSPPQQTIISLYKNGVLFRLVEPVSSTNPLLNFAYSFQDSASGTDYYEIFVSHSSSVTCPVNGTATKTWLMGSMI